MTTPFYNPDNNIEKGGAISWMARHSQAANLLMVLFLVGGLLTAFSIKQEVFPESKSNTVRVVMYYPGASPEEVEKGIILAIEDALEGLDGVDEITSIANEGIAVITIEAIAGADINRLWQETTNEIERIGTFPDEAERPTVSIPQRQFEAIRFAIYGNFEQLELLDFADYVRNKLLAHKEITQVQLMGNRDREIHVDVPSENLRRYNITLADIARKISDVSFELGAGKLKTPDGEVLLRVRDRVNFASEYAQLPVISKPDGSQLPLDNIAQISENLEESDSWASFNGKKAILLSVYRVGEQTPAQVTAAAKKIIDEIQTSMPEGTGIVEIRDMSKIFVQRADLLLSNAYIGLALVFIFLALFLEIRLAFWVSLGIPISFLGSFLLLAPTYFSINIITMFAYIVTLGIVVDDAVVVGENIYHYRKQGHSSINSAIMGAKTIATPVIFSVITNMIAFLPLLFVPGSMGRSFKHLPLVVVAVFFVSLIESLFILPAHLGHAKKRNLFFPFNLIEQWQKKFSHSFEIFVHKNYGRLIAYLLRHRYNLLAGGVALLLITSGYLLSGRMGMVLLPKVESDYAFCQAQLPYGSASSLTREVETRLIESAQAVIDENGGKKLAKGVFSYVNKNSIKVYLQLTQPDIRPVNTSDVTRIWRQKTGKLAGLESISFESDRGGPSSGKNLSIALNHENHHILETAAQELAEAIKQFPIAKDIDDGSAKGKSQIDISLTREGQRMGLTSKQVASQVRHAFQGAIAVRNQRNNGEVTVRVRLPLEERRSMTSYENLVLQSPQGEIMLRDAATTKPGRAYTSIKRANGKREIVITANVRPAYQVENMIKNMKKDILPELLANYPGLSYQLKGKQADIRESMGALIKGLCFGLFCIFALLAIPFQSYSQPMIIMFSIPFGIIGAIAGHVIMGYSLSIISMFGLIALSGVVVNDGLVLIDLINQKVRQNIPVREAVIEASIQRFRPILLTTLTTCGGLAPMIMETSRQARFLIPMAISLGFGLLFATIITLGLVPSLYIILEDIKNIFKQ